jgi:hypothetical protein
MPAVEARGGAKHVGPDDRGEAERAKLTADELAFLLAQLRELAAKLEEAQAINRQMLAALALFGVPFGILFGPVEKGAQAERRPLR